MTFDRRAIDEMYDYTAFAWASFGNAVCALGADAFARPVAGSGWPSLRDAFAHIATAWDGWLVEYTGQSAEIRERESFSSWEELDAHRSALRTLLRAAIDRTGDDALDARTVELRGGIGHASPGEVLAHILLHELRHHGDVNTLLSQHGAQPPAIDYLVYLWFKRRQEAPGA